MTPAERISEIRAKLPARVEPFDYSIFTGLELRLIEDSIFLLAEIDRMREALKNSCFCREYAYDVKCPACQALQGATTTEGK